MAKPYVSLATNALAKVGETFQVYVSLSPASKSQEKVTMDQTWGTTFSQSTFVLGPGEEKTISATVKRSVSGLAWIHARAVGYTDGWQAVVVDFDGGLKLNSSAKLSYGSAASLTISVIDKEGKLLRLPSTMKLHLASADGLLHSENSDWKGALDLELPPGSVSSPQFQFRPTSIQGGSLHLVGSLLIPDQPQVLTQEEFPLNADPAWWLPPLLAVTGDYCMEFTRFCD